MRNIKNLWDIYQFPGFRVERRVAGVFGDPYALVLRLQRRGKKRFAGSAAVRTGHSTTARFAGFETFPVETVASTWRWRFAGFVAGVAGR